MDLENRILLELFIGFSIEKYGSEILKYDGTPIASQSLHEAVYNIDTGEKTCNNAQIRLFGYMQNFFGNRTEEKKLLFILPTEI